MVEDRNNLGPQALAKATNALVARLAVLPADALARSKRAINAATLGGLDDALATEREGQHHLLAAADFIEGVAAFGEKRKAAFGERSITL